MGEPETGPIDRQVLGLLEGKLAAYPIVDSTTYDPDPYEPRQLHAILIRDRFPPRVETAWIDIRWFETDDFGLHYIESHENRTWHCRWDRHPNPHNTRCHFHEPPDCESVVDLSLSETNPIPVLFAVLAAIEDRIERLWDQSPVGRG